MPGNANLLIGVFAFWIHCDSPSALHATLAKTPRLAAPCCTVSPLESTATKLPVSI